MSDDALPRPTYLDAASRILRSLLTKCNHMLEIVDKETMATDDDNDVEGGGGGGDEDATQQYGYIPPSAKPATDRTYGYVPRPTTGGSDESPAGDGAEQAASAETPAEPAPARQQYGLTTAATGAGAQYGLSSAARKPSAAARAVRRKLRQTVTRSRTF